MTIGEVRLRRTQPASYAALHKRKKALKDGTWFAIATYCLPGCIVAAVIVGTVIVRASFDLCDVIIIAEFAEAAVLLAAGEAWCFGKHQNQC